MIVLRTFNSSRQLVDLYRGSPVSLGGTGTNTAASGNFADATGTPFSEVEVGDRLSISGESTTFVVTVVTDDNNIVVTPVIPTLHDGSAYATWRIFRGGLTPANIVAGPFQDASNGSAGYLLYDAPSFSN